MSKKPPPTKRTLCHLRQMKATGEKITMLTAYDATFARVFSEAGLDVILVGDTLGMIIGGHDTTLPVTVADVQYHVQNVARAKPHSLIIGDMPFLSYSNEKEAIKNAKRLMQSGAEMIKIEGGEWLLPTIEKMNTLGIPVCTHLGLTPQSIHLLGGYKIQGRQEEQAAAIQRAALAQEKAGAQMLVLECVPHTLACQITQSLNIPVIGIGAGVHCDGQVLVSYDMLGLNPQINLRFVRNFLNGQNEGIPGAVKEYIRQVKSSTFPGLEQSFT